MKVFSIIFTFHMILLLLILFSRFNYRKMCDVGVSIFNLSLNWQQYIFSSKSEIWWKWNWCMELLRGIERGITKSWSRSPVTLVSGKGPRTCNPIFKTLVTLPFQRVGLLAFIRTWTRYVCAESANFNFSFPPYFRYFFTLLVTSSFYLT